MTAVAKADRRTLAVCDWPEPDQRAWSLGLRPYDPLERGIGFASRWRPATLKGVENGYGRWLRWLATEGLLDVTLEPGARVTRDAVRHYLDALETGGGQSKKTLSGRLQQLSMALKAMDQSGDWSWVTRASSRLRSDHRTTGKQLERMQPAEDVLQLGLDLMHHADHDRFRTECERATLFRDGLLIAFLILRPFRRTNLTNLTLGEHIEKRGGVWQLYLPVEETKTGNSVDTTWPERLAAQLERYLDVHRPTLMHSSKGKHAQTKALWISGLGRAMEASSIYAAVCLRTRNEYGAPINPHSFRHIVATAIATNNPAAAPDIAAVLCHTTLAVSERYYNKAQMKAAGDALHKTIETLRGPSRNTRRRG